ncbi:MAG: L,D-transpeptidase family protein [Candidatus Nanopelagicales bacterium]|nr:L,D-transpeptidase family protein [Candidatus Nanopelagicales bacterium]
MRRILAVSIAAGLAAITLLVPATTAGASTPGILDAITASDQVVLVTGPSTRATRGTLRRFARVQGAWTPVGAPSPVLLGRSGLVDGSRRVQSSGTTPMGTYRLASAFGRAADPGSRLPYVRVDRDDAWTYNPQVPSTYNLFQSAARSWAGYGRYVEHLWQMGPQYDYVVTTDFNEPPVASVRRGADGVRRTSQPSDTRRGGGIFLHVSKGEPTAGCVSMPRAAMRTLVTWLDPASNPVVVITTTSRLTA